MSIRSRAPAELLVAAGILVLAFGARLTAALKGSGLDGIMYYDDGVNFAAAIGLVHGRLPYRDFLFLHPPGIVLALAPFAGVANVTSDAVAFIVTRLCFMIVGGVNAVLVARFLLPCSKVAAVLGGVLYAVFWPAIYSERTPMLQVLANTCLLASLIAISPAESPPSRRRFVISGVLLGLGAVIKIWGFLPILILFGWVLRRFDARRAGLLLVGAMASATVVCLPFFLAAPAQMWQLVVRNQLLRMPTNSSPIERLTDILGLDTCRTHHTLLVIALASAVGGVVLAWREQQARPQCCCSRHGDHAVAPADLVRPLRRFECPGNCHHGRRDRPAAAAPCGEMAAAPHRCRCAPGHRSADGCAPLGAG